MALTYIWFNTTTYTWTHRRTHACTLTHTIALTYTCTHTCTYTHAHTCLNTITYTRMHARSHTHTCTHTHVILSYMHNSYIPSLELALFGWYASQHLLLSIALVSLVNHSGWREKWNRHATYMCLCKSTVLVTCSKSTIIFCLCSCFSASSLCSLWLSTSAILAFSSTCLDICIGESQRTALLARNAYYKVHTHFTHMYIHAHTRTCTHTCTHVHTHIQTRIHTYVHTCTHVHTYSIYKHVYTHMHTHIRT